MHAYLGLHVLRHRRRPLSGERSECSLLVARPPAPFFRDEALAIARRHVAVEVEHVDDAAARARLRAWLATWQEGR
jgi:hypothetical protein